MKEVFHTIMLVFVMILVNIKARSIYTWNFVIGLIQSLSITIVSAGIIWIILDKFKDFNGWTLYQLGFMYALAKLAFALVMSFFSVLMVMDYLINIGEIDRLLIRPKPSIILFIFQRFDIIFLGEIMTSLFILFYCANKTGLVWNSVNILLLIIFIISSFLILASILFITGTSAFWFLKSGSLREFVMTVYNIFNPYPIEIYAKYIQVILSILLPLAFIYYYPALYFFNKDAQLFLPWISVCSPLVAAVFTGIGLLAWNLGLKNYKSAGS